MAYAMSIDMGINPVMNTKTFDKQLKQLSNKLTKIKRGRHEDAQRMTANLISGMMLSGRATTSTQGRMYLSDAMGIDLTRQHKAILRGGQNLADFYVRDIKKSMAGSYASRKTSAAFLPQFQAFSEKEMGRMDRPTASIAQRYNETLDKYNEWVKGGMQRSETRGLEKSLSKLDKSINKLVQETKKVSKPLERVSKNAEKMSGVVAQRSGSGSVSAGAGALNTNMFKNVLRGAFGNLFTLQGIQKIIGHVINKVQESFTEGRTAFINQTIWGADRNLGRSSAYSKLFGVSEQAAGSVEEYSLNFAERMKWGRISDPEWIALSQMGEVGEMLKNGTAAKKPKEFLKKWTEYIGKTDAAVVRRHVGDLGLPLEAMGLGGIKHSEKDIEDFVGFYEDAVRMAKQNAIIETSPYIGLKKYMQTWDVAEKTLYGYMMSSPEAKQLLGQTIASRTGFSSKELSRSAQTAKVIGLLRAKKMREKGGLNINLAPSLFGRLGGLFTGSEHTTELDYAYPGLTGMSDYLGVGNYVNNMNINVNSAEEAADVATGVRRNSVIGTVNSAEGRAD